MTSKNKFKQFLQDGNKRLIKNYFVSYVLIFLFPFLILSGVLYWSFIQSIEKQAEVNNNSNIRQVQMIIENQFNILSNISNQIAISPQLTKYMLEDPYYNKDGRAELKRFELNNPLISNLFIYYPSNQTFYSAAGLYSFDAFTKKMHYLELDEEELKENLMTSTSLVITNAKKNTSDEAVVSYFVPLKNQTNDQYGTVVFYLKNSELERILANSTENKEDGIFLFDHSGQVIASSNNQLDSQVLYKTLHSFSQKKITYHKNHYLFSKKALINDSLELYSLMDYSLYTQQLANLIKLFILIVILILFAGIILSFYLSYRQYQPFIQLDKSFQKLSLGEYPTEEVLFMEQSVFGHKAISFFENHYTLQQEVDEQQHIMKTLFLSRLLEGKTGNVQELQKKITEFGLPFEHGLYTVCIAQPYMNIQTAQTESLDSSILQKFPLTINHVTIEALQLPFSNSFIFILFYQDETLKEFDSKEYLVFEAAIHNVIQANYRFFYGNAYPNAMHISQSYKEAQSAQEYGLFHPENSSVFYREIAKINDSFSLSFQHQILSKLQNSLSNGNLAESKEAIQALFKDERLKNVSSSAIKCYYFDIVNLMLKIAVNADIPLPQKKVKTIVNIKTFAESQQNIEQLATLICESLQEKKSVEKIKQESDIIRYIKENYTSHTFSLENTAQHFHLSTPYLSRLIKQEIGLTFSKYVQELRLNKIKQDLIETDLPIKTIIVNAGYYDISNYSRKFKQITGLTPGQYRELNQK